VRIELAEDRVQWRALVLAPLNLRVLLLYTIPVAIFTFLSAGWNYEASAVQCGLLEGSVCWNVSNCMWILLIVDCIRGNRLYEALARERYSVSVSLMIFCYHANAAHGFRMGRNELANEDEIQQSEALSAAAFIPTAAAPHICSKSCSYIYIYIYIYI
jgi:hypothetical protein